MQPLKRKEAEIVSDPELFRDAKVHAISMEAVVVNSGGFDLTDFKKSFESAGGIENRYYLLRELAANPHPLPLSELQNVICQFPGFEKLKLHAFLIDYRNEPAFACAKHFGELAELEQTCVATDRRAQVKEALQGYAPPLKILAALFGDSLTSGTHLAGGQVSVTVGIFYECLKAMKILYNYENANLLNQLAELGVWSQKLNSIPEDAKEEGLNALCQEMIDHFSKTGALLIPGGWVAKRSGHEQIYHIQNKNNRFTFDIYNSGGGLDLHLSKPCNDKSKRSPVFKVNNPNPKRFTQRFLAVLLGNQVFRPSQNANDRCPEEIYDLIIDGLQARREGAEESTVFITGQRGPTCYLRVLFAFLHQNLPEREFERFKFYFQEIHFALIPENNSEVDSLLEDISKNLYRHIDKLYSTKVIDFTEFFRMFSLLAYVPRIEKSSDFIEFPKLALFNSRLSINKLQTNLESITRSPPNFFDEVLENFPHVKPLTQVNEIVPQLEMWVTSLNSLLHYHETLLCLYLYVQIFDALPLIEDPVWSEMLPDQLMGTINQLLQLSKFCLLLDKNLESGKLVHRAFLFFLIRKLSQLLIEKEFVESHELIQNLCPFSINITRFSEVTTVLSPTLMQKYLSVKESMQVTGTNCWFGLGIEQAHLIFLGPNNPIVKFINDFLVCSGMAHAIPVPYQDEFYLEILQNKVGLPKYIFDLINQFNLLFTDQKEILPYHFQKASNPHSGTMVLFKMADPNTYVKECSDLYPPKKDFAAPAVRIHSVLAELKSQPTLLKEDKFRQKFSSSFFRTVPGGTNLFIQELNCSFPNSCLDRLHGILKEQLHLACETGAWSLFLFLFRFINDVVKQLEISKVQDARFEELITEDHVMSFYQLLPPDTRRTFEFSVLNWFENRKIFNVNWLKWALRVTLAGPKDVRTKASIALLARRESEFKQAFDSFLTNNRDEFHALLNEAGLSELKKVEWPFLHTSLYKQHLFTGKITTFDGKNTFYYKHDDKKHSQIFKTIFSKETLLVRVNSDMIVSSDEKILLLKSHRMMEPKERASLTTVEKPQLDLFVSGHKLQDIYGISLESVHWTRSYRYLPSYSQITDPLFRLERYDVWHNMDHHEYLIFDRIAKSYICSYMENDSLTYEDKTRSLSLISKTSPGLNSIFSIINRFDNLTKTFIWQKKNSLDVVVEFPTYGLSFDFSAEDKKIYSREFKGFYLDKIPLEWEHGKKGLTLIDDQNHRKFILPRYIYTSFALPMNIVYQSELRVGNMATSEEYLVIDIESPDRLLGDLQYSGSPRDRLYFAAYLAISGEFRLAINLVRNLVTYTNNNELENDLAKMTGFAFHHYHDGHPDFIAFQLHLIHFQMLIQGNKKLDTAWCNHCVELLESYSRSVHNVDIKCRIDVNQASILNELSSESGSPWNIFYKSLKGIRNKNEIKSSTTYLPAQLVQDLTDLNTLLLQLTVAKTRWAVNSNPTNLESIYTFSETLVQCYLTYFRDICYALKNNRDDFLYDTLYRGIYLRNKATDITKRSEYLARTLAFIVNTKACCDYLKERVSDDLLKEDGLIPLRALLIKEFIPKLKSLAFESDFEGFSKLPEILKIPEIKGTPGVQKRNRASNINQAKKSRSERSLQYPDLLDKYFKLEVETYPRTKIEIQKPSLAMARLLEKINEDLENHSQSFYYLKDPSKFHELKEELRVLAADANERFLKAEKNLINVCTHSETTSSQMLIDQLLEIARQRGVKNAAFSFIGLLNQYINSQNNPFHSEKLSQAVDEWVNAYVNQKTIAAAYEETDPGKVSVLLQRPVREDSYIEKVISFFEITSGKLIRQKQWSILGTSQLHDRYVAQISSGEGKTSYITPAYALYVMVTKNQTVFNVVPFSNIETNYEQLRQFFTRYTCYRVERIFYQRSSPDELLHRISALIDSSARSRVVFVVDPVSLQALLLKYFEVLLGLEGHFGLSKDSVAHHDNLCIESAEKIISHIKDQSTAVVDEQHIILSPLHYLNYATANEIPLEPFRWKLSQKLYQYMYRYNMNATKHFFPIGKWRKEDFSTDFYHSKQINILLDMYASDSTLKLDEDLLKEYIFADRFSMDKTTREKLKKWLESLPTSVQDELKLLKTQLRIYLPHTLSARSFVDYGSSKDKTYAIPYAGNMKASEQSAFQNNDILINYTIQLYYINGLKKEEVHKIASMWKNKEILSGIKPPITVNQKTLSLLKWDLDDKRVLDQLVGILKDHPSAIQDYVDYFVFPEIKVQGERLSSTAYDLSNVLFLRILAFTATLLSNYDTLPYDMKKEFDSSVHAEMINCFYSSQHTEFLVRDILDFDELLKIPNLSMVLDPHAVLEGRLNSSVAEELAQKGKAIFDRVDYFGDQSNVLTSISCNEMKNPSKRALTYCDQLHTTGVDTIQPHNGVALILAKHGLTFTELMQAAKRMRQYGKGQKIVIFMTRSLELEILKTMDAQKMTHQLFVLWTLLNESEIMHKSTSISFEQHLQSIYRRLLIDALFKSKTKTQKSSVVNKYRGLLVEKVNNNEYLEFASLEQPKSPLTAFQEKLKEYEQLYGDLLDPKSKEDIAALERMAKVYLPQKSLRVSTEGLNVTAQKEQQVYKETQDQVKTPVKNANPFPSFDALVLLNKKSLYQGWTTNKFDNAFKVQIKRLPVFEASPITAVDPRSYEDLFFTSAFLGMKQNQIVKGKFKKAFPKVEFILSLIGPRQKHRYVLISKRQAHDFRRAFLQFENKPCKMEAHVYLLDGYEITSSTGNPKKLDDRILAIFRFINGETMYPGPLRVSLKSWLKEGNTSQKISQFLKKATDSGLVLLRSLQGTDVQLVFDELKQELKFSG